MTLKEKDVGRRRPWKRHWKKGTLGKQTTEDVGRRVR